MEKDMYKLHCENVHQTNIVGFCDLCSKSFTSVNGLRLHQNMHKGERGGCPKCPICGKICQGMSFLKVHLRVHSDHREFSCDKCGRAYKNKNKLKFHNCHT